MYSLVIGLALAVGAPAPKEAPKKDPPSLVGLWVAESGLRGGQMRPPPPGTSMEFTADGKVFMRERGGEKSMEATYKADPKKDPAELDIIPPLAGKGELLGIFKIDGDTLTICFAENERPAKFESPEGSRAMLVTLRRQKKD